MLKRAYIEITNICNLSCSFCPGTRRPPRTMTPEEFRRLAEKLRGHVGYLYFHVMGGWANCWASPGSMASGCA